MRRIALAPVLFSCLLVASNALTGVAAGQPRIVGGVVANRAETPWFVFLNPIVDGQSYACGGTVIGSRWIMTAAHCVTDGAGRQQSAWDVGQSGAYVNPVSITSAADIGVRIGFEQVWVNPWFSRDTFVNDIALVKTSSAMSATPLPFSSDNSGPTSGTALQVFGFGATSFGGSLSPVLRMGNVLDLAGISGPCGQYGSIYDAHGEVCAGFPPGPTDSCQGDSGGPLTVPAQTATRVVAGIVSFGFECGTVGYPGVYARVASFAAWISSITGIAPNASLVGVHSAADLAVKKPCPGTSRKPCRLKRGGKLRLTLVNRGGTAASWQIRASRLKINPASGSLASGASRTSTLTTTTGRRTCVSTTVSSQGGKTEAFKISTNGGKCRG